MANIAIIGSGISGIGCAYFLNSHHNITIFEKNNYIGGHANTATIQYPLKNSLQKTTQKISVDTGFIVYNFKTYHNLKPFFEELKVDIAKSKMSFAISAQSGLEYSGQSLSGLFAQKSNLLKAEFIKMLFDIAKFNKAAIKLVEEQNLPNTTLQQFIDSLNLGKYFKEYYLLPITAAIWSCKVELMKNYPAQSFLQFFYNHGLLTITKQPQWYTVKGGSKEYIKKAVSGFKDKILLNNAANKVFQNSDGSFTLIDQTNRLHKFDKVIFACHASDTLKILSDARDDEKEILGKFKYSQNTAILHRDLSQMPQNKKAWASWVYLSANQQNKVSLTYWMNNLQNIDNNCPLFVTLNPISKIKESLTFGKYSYNHPIFDLKALEAQKKLPTIQNRRNLYFCGAYSGYGFHEDGLRSALNIANLLNIKASWQ
jgi:predicted NAD/FAD-binding protein